MRAPLLGHVVKGEELRGWTARLRGERHDGNVDVARVVLGADPHDHVSTSAARQEGVNSTDAGSQDRRDRLPERGGTRYLQHGSRGGVRVRDPTISVHDEDAIDHLIDECLARNGKDLEKRASQYCPQPQGSSDDERERGEIEVQGDEPGDRGCVGDERCERTQKKDAGPRALVSAGALEGPEDESEGDEDQGVRIDDEHPVQRASCGRERGERPDRMRDVPHIEEVAGVQPFKVIERE